MKRTIKHILLSSIGGINVLLLDSILAYTGIFLPGKFEILLILATLVMSYFEMKAFNGAYEDFCLARNWFYGTKERRAAAIAAPSFSFYPLDNYLQII